MKYKVVFAKKLFNKYVNDKYRYKCTERRKKIDKIQSFLNFFFIIIKREDNCAQLGFQDASRPSFISIVSIFLFVYIVKQFNKKN